MLVLSLSCSHQMRHSVPWCMTFKWRRKTKMELTKVSWQITSVTFLIDLCFIPLQTAQDWMAFSACLWVTKWMHPISVSTLTWCLLQWGQAKMKWSLLHLFMSLLFDLTGAKFPKNHPESKLGSRICVVCAILAFWCNYSPSICCYSSFYKMLLFLCRFET